jgi:phage terminase small subunit
MKNDLTDKQKRFVQEYLIDLNASAAARRSGYSEVNSDKIGSELLGKTRVQRAIQEQMQTRSQRLQISAERVVQELAAIGFADIQGLFEFKHDKISIKNDIFSNPQRSKVIRGVSVGTHGVSLLFHDRLKALDLLLKHISLNPNQFQEEKESTTDQIKRLWDGYKKRQAKIEARAAEMEAEEKKLQVP